MKYDVKRNPIYTIYSQDYDASKADRVCEGEKSISEVSDKIDSEKNIWEGEKSTSEVSDKIESARNIWDRKEKKIARKSVGLNKG